LGVTLFVGIFRSKAGAYFFEEGFRLANVGEGAVKFSGAADLQAGFGTYRIF